MNAIFAVVEGIVLATTAFFPPNQQVFYLTVVVIIVMPILWYSLVRTSFEDFPEGDKIKERQKLIADIETRFTDSSAE